MMVSDILFLSFLLFESILCNGSCTSKDYVNCDDNNSLNCISKEWWCDGNQDCESGKDESNCPQKSCLDTEFLCNSGTQCIPKLLLCDGIFHCVDKSDEKNCNKSSTKTCNSTHEFDCNNDGNFCIPVEKMCDKKNDCKRNQDELPGNSVDNCQRNDCKSTENGGCSHYCTNFYTYIKCHCPIGYKLLPDNKTCIDIDECSESPRRCHQICKNTPGSYECSCYHGYYLNQHKPGQCIVKDGDRSILITLNGGRQLTIDLNTGHNFSNSLNDLQETWTKIDIDLHHAPQMLFWSKQSNGGLGQSKIKFNGDGDGKYQFLNDNRLFNNQTGSSCTGLSFDWLRGLLFWTSAKEQRIYVTNTTSNVTSVLLNKGLLNPQSIVVDPFETVIYWIDWGNKQSSAKIEMMLMNKANRKVLVSENLRQPLDILIDFYEKRLYWSDIDPGSIHYIDLSGPSRPVTILSNKLLHPFSIAIFENKIYWTDWRQNQIISIDKTSSDDYKVLAKVVKPLAIRVLNKVNQPELHESIKTNHVCLINKIHLCTHICLPFPPNMNNKNNMTKYKCMCPSNSELGDDQSTCHNFEDLNFLGKRHQSTRYKIISGVTIGLAIILCLSISILCVYVYRQRSWANSNKCLNRKAFNHPIVTGDLMFIFKCNSHSSQKSNCTEITLRSNSLSELLASDINSIA